MLLYSLNIENLLSSESKMVFSKLCFGIAGTAAAAAMILYWYRKKQNQKHLVVTNKATNEEMEITPLINGNLNNNLADKTIEEQQRLKARQDVMAVTFRIRSVLQEVENTEKIALKIERWVASNEVASVYYATGPNGGQYALKVFENKTSAHKCYSRLLENVDVEAPGSIMNLYTVENSNLGVIVTTWEECYGRKTAVDLQPSKVPNFQPTNEKTEIAPLINGNPTNNLADKTIEEQQRLKEKQDVMAVTFRIRPVLKEVENTEKVALKIERWIASNKVESVYYATGPNGGQYAVKVFENKTSAQKCYSRLMQNVDVEATGSIMNLYIFENSNLAVVVATWEECYGRKGIEVPNFQ